MISLSRVWRCVKASLSTLACAILIWFTLVMSPVAASASTTTILMYNSQHVLVDVSYYYYEQQGHVFNCATGQSVGSVSEPSGNILDQNNNVIGEIVVTS